MTSRSLCLQEKKDFIVTIAAYLGDFYLFETCMHILKTEFFSLCVCVCVLQEGYSVLGVEEILSQSIPLDQVSESQESTYEHRHDVIVIETDSNSEEEGGVEEAGKVRHLSG